LPTFAAASYVPIDLSAYCNFSLSSLYAAPPTGSQVFAGVPFRIGTGANNTIATDDGGMFAGLPETQAISVNKKAYSIFLILDGAYVHQANQTWGRLTFTYDSGVPRVVTLTSGFNIRDWVASGSGQSVRTTSALYVQEIYRGDPQPINNWAPGSAVFDLMSFTLDSTRVLKSVTLEDLRPSTGGLMLSAMTIDAVPAATVSGHADLANFVGSPAGINVDFFLMNGDTVIETHSSALDASGYFYFEVTEAGTFDIVAKPSHWLSTRIPGVTLQNDVGINISFDWNGDIVSDNLIDEQDVWMVFLNFRKTANPADLDGSGRVDLWDLNVTFLNFDLQGET
jgi:hypothetical protein